MVGSTEVIDNSEKCRRREEKRKKDDKEKFNKWEKEGQSYQLLQKLI